MNDAVPSRGYYIFGLTVACVGEYAHATTYYYYYYYCYYYYYYGYLCHSSYIVTGITLTYITGIFTARIDRFIRIITRGKLSLN